MMRRRLVFDGEKAEKRFQFCRQALLAAGGGLTIGTAPGNPRTKDVIRQEAHLLDVLDTISVEAPVDEDKDHRTLTPPTEGTVLTVELKQVDYALLAKYVDTMPWLPRVAREAVDVMDWLSAADKLED